MGGINEQTNRPSEVSRMLEWKCSRCGYALSAEAPPEVCPSCQEKCDFLNVTCYTPECQCRGRDDRL